MNGGDDRMNQRSEAVIVTHAGPSVGGGHASRCLALAQGLAAHGAVVCWLVNDFAGEVLLRGGVPEEAVTVLESPFDGSGRLTSEAERFSGAALFVVDSGLPRSHSWTTAGCVRWSGSAASC